MTPLSITTNLDIDPWIDLAKLTDDEVGTIARIGLMPNGTHSGRPVVMLDVVLPDGRHVIAQTTWALMNMAARALAATPVAELDRMENP